MADYNIIAAVGGGIVTVLAGYTVFRLSKAFDARSQAEAALIGIGPQIIKEQNDRIDRLNVRIDDQSKTIDTLWTRERECREELTACRDEMGAIDRRYRHFVSSLLQHVLIMRRMLRKAGLQLPSLEGLERFREDGGTPREEWVKAIQEDESD